MCLNLPWSRSQAGRVVKAEGRQSVPANVTWRDAKKQSKLGSLVAHAVQTLLLWCRYEWGVALSPEVTGCAFHFRRYFRWRSFASFCEGCNKFETMTCSKTLPHCFHWPSSSHSQFPRQVVCALHCVNVLANCMWMIAALSSFSGQHQWRMALHDLGLLVGSFGRLVCTPHNDGAQSQPKSDDQPWHYLSVLNYPARLESKHVSRRCGCCWTLAEI